MQNDSENVYMKNSIACFAADAERNVLVKISKLMPFLTPLLTQTVKSATVAIGTLQGIAPKLMGGFDGVPALWIIQQVEDVVKERLKSGTERTDLLQLMLDAATDDETKVG